jgi:hypothetical protein
MPHGALLLTDTTAAVSAVADAFARLLLSLEGVSTPFRTLALFLAHLVPIPLARANGGT